MKARPIFDYLMKLVLRFEVPKKNQERGHSITT